MVASYGGIYPRTCRINARASVYLKYGCSTRSTAALSTKWVTHRILHLPIICRYTLSTFSGAVKRSTTTPRRIWLPASSSEPCNTTISLSSLRLLLASTTYRASSATHCISKRPTVMLLIWPENVLLGAHSSDKQVLFSLVEPPATHCVMVAIFQTALPHSATRMGTTVNHCQRLHRYQTNVKCWQRLFLSYGLQYDLPQIYPVC